MAKQEETPKSNKRALRQHNLKFQAVPEKEYEVIQYDNPEVVKKIEQQYPDQLKYRLKCHPRD